MSKPTLFMFGVIITFLSLTPKLNAQSKIRDLNNYIAGPVFDLSGHKSQDEKEKSIEYLWDAWNNKKQTFFSVYTYNRGGYRIACNYYVEKNNVDSWQVVSSCINEDCPWQSEEVCREQEPLESIYDNVEKVNRSVEAEDSDNNKYFLILENSISNIVTIY